MFFRNINSGAQVALEILREGNLTTFVVLLWLVVGAVAIYFVRKTNVPLEKRAHRRKGRASSEGSSSKKSRRATKSKNRGKASKNRQSSSSAGTDDLGEAEANTASARKKPRKAAQPAETSDSDDSSDFENELFERTKRGKKSSGRNKDLEKARAEQDVKKKPKEEAVKQKGRKGKKSFDAVEDGGSAADAASKRPSPHLEGKESPALKEQVTSKKSSPSPKDKNLFLQQKKRQQRSRFCRPR